MIHSTNTFFVRSSNLALLYRLLVAHGYTARIEQTDGFLIDVFIDLDDMKTIQFSTCTAKFEKNHSINIFHFFDGVLVKDGSETDLLRLSFDGNKAIIDYETSRGIMGRIIHKETNMEHDIEHDL